MASASTRILRPAPQTARLTALIVACALFMQSLDSTVISTALPTMARVFGVDVVRMNVALTAYLLALTMFIPASGWVADRFGARDVFRAAIAVFTLASVLCGRADTLGFLVAARVLQGIGGAMMVPVGRLLLVRNVPKSELVSAMAWLTIPALVGPVVGPPLGGLLVTYASWRWIFDINVPVGVLGIGLVTLFVRDVREPLPGRFDTAGLLLSSGALAGTLVGLEILARGLLPPWVGAAVLAAGCCCVGLYVRHARTAENPLLRLALLRTPTFAVSVGSGTLFRIGIGAVPFLLPVMLQLGFGASAARSGAITFASSAGALVMKPAVRSALRRFGFRRTLVWNGVLSAASLAVCAAFRPAWPLAAIYAALLLGGFLRSLQFTAYNTLAYAEIARPEMSAATSFYSTAQQLSQTLGIAFGAGLLQLAMTLHGHATPALEDFSVAFVAVALVVAAASPLAARLPADAGAEMAGRAPAPVSRPG